MSLHPTAFEYLSPSNNQKDEMAIVRSAAAGYAKVLEQVLPDGPDKTYILRKLREVAMWANVAITRQSDGSPRDPL